MQLIITISKIKGHCPVYAIGDKIVLDQGYQVNLNQTDNICMHSLGAILPYYNALAKGIRPQALGLNNDDSNRAFVQCSDPCEYTDGGTVIFEIKAVNCK